MVLITVFFLFLFRVLKQIILNHGDILQNSAPCHGDISLRKWRIHIWLLVGYCDHCECCARARSTGGRGFRKGPIVIGHLRSRDCGYYCLFVCKDCFTFRLSNKNFSIFIYSCTTVGFLSLGLRRKKINHVKFCCFIDEDWLSFSWWC